MMLEGLARIRVEEAIRTGLKEQHTRRNLPPERRSNLMGYLRILVLVLTITILSTGCSAIAGTTSSDEPEPVTESGPSRFTITMTPEKIDIPAAIPAGLVALTIDNADSEWHSAIFRKLNQDVSLEDFEAAFRQDPRSTLPMTTFIGGPDVPGKTTMPGYYPLEAGTYIVVDNWTEPWRFASFKVEGQTAQEMQPPRADVQVMMDEYTIEMPDSFPKGRRLWQFTNQGEFPHNVAIIRLSEDQSLDDIAVWLNEEPGPEPFEYFTMWNIVSPGITSWGEIELQPGEYLAVDFMPDFGSEDGLNIDQGMVSAFTVTP